MHASRVSPGILGLILAFALGGCTTYQAASAGSQPARAAHHAHGMAAAAGDPASELFAHCSRQQGDAKTACYEERVLALLEQEGVAATLGVVERLTAMDADVQRDAHVYAHLIGIAAYESAETVGSTFASCTPAFQSGCYHGVIQAYFTDLRRQGPGAVDSASVNALCREVQGEGADRWLLFQCVHGLGHGLVMLYDHDLPRALEGCDLLDGLWERESCYGGALMENIVNATMPHHPAGADGHAHGHGHGHGHAHHGEHAHHGHEHHAHHEGHAAHAEREPFRALDPEDPHYPCSVLDARYQRQCYQMQTSAVLFHNGYDFVATAAFCDEAPELVRPDCYQSLGRDINAYTSQNHEKTNELCAVGNPQYQPWCHIGVAKNLVDLTADAEDGLAYCRTVAGERNRAVCFLAVGEQIAVLEQEPQRREALCGGADQDHIETCRYGAGLTTERPATLQG